MSTGAGAAGSGGGERTGLDVMFPAHRDLGDWARRHALGEVPSRWPYGLDRFDRLDLEVRPVALPAGGVRRLVSRAIAAAPRRGAGARVGLTWDENAASSMVRHAPRHRMVSGVIWATDAPDPDPRVVDGLRRLDAAWVLSTGQLVPLMDLLGPGVPVHHVRFGIDTDFFRPEPYPGRPLVLSIGNDRDRDVESLYAALSVVVGERPGTRVVVQSRSSTPPPEGVEVIEQVSHLRLRELYAEASVVTMMTRPNQHVSGMTVALEAAATGRPVVMTETPGLADYVEDGVSGLTCAVSDSSGVAERIIALLDDPDRAQSLGRSGSRLVATGLTTDHLVARLAEIVAGR